LIAWSKIVGFEVSPVTDSSSMYRASVPPVRRERVMLSSQRLWPASCNCCVAFMGFPSARRVQQRGHVVGREVADPIDGHVRRRMACDVGRRGVVPLAREDRRQPLAPVLLDGGQDPDLVVHEHVVGRRMAALDVVELLLLVDVDEHAALDRLEQARSIHLERLEDHVAVREDDGRAERAGVLERIERAGEEAVRERVVHEIGGDREQVRLARVLHAIPLQRSEVVRVPELGAELLEDVPVLPLPPLTHLLRSGSVSGPRRSGRCR
jgi:hypothetical protein